MKKIIILLSAFYCFYTNAQSIGIGDGFITPNGFLDNVYDNYGNNFTLKNVLIGPKQSIIDSTKILESHLLCTSGIFELYFEKGSGMELANNPNHIARRNVICTVFNDVSNFIITPLKDQNNGTKIKIWIRDFDEVQNTQNYGISYGSSYYNLPKNQSAASITDNQLWKTILSGVDAYKNISQNTEQYYHAAFAFKFNGDVKWHTNLNSLASFNKYDLYTYTLKEVVHALGFVSLLTKDGTSKFGNEHKFYSRFDAFLKNQNGQKLLTLGNCSPMNDVVFSGNVLDLSTNCGNNNFINNFSNCSNTIQFVGTNTIDLYTPNCYNAVKSLNFVNSNCGLNFLNSFLMSENPGLGITRRKMNIEERDMLNDLGYSFNNTFGDISTFTFKNYNSQAISQSVVGINDGFNSSGNIMYFGNTNEPLLLANFLNNDSGSNLSFECLKDESHNATIFSAHNGESTTPVEISTTIPGYHLISYVPYDSLTGVRGNKTYVYVYFAVLCSTLPQDCNLVFNGNFEQNTDFPDNVTQIERSCNWIAARNSPDYFHTSAYSGQVDIPNNAFGNQNVFASSGNAYAGLAIIRNSLSSFYIEVIGTELVSPLEPNTNYQLSFNISRADLYPGAIRFQAYLGNNLTFVSPNNIAIEPNGILLTNPIFTTNATGWDTITFNFTTGVDAGQTHLYLGGLNGVVYQGTSPLQRTYYYIDNVRLRPPSEIFNPSFDLPQTICVSASSINLSQLVGNTTDTFSGAGVSLIAGEYFFDPNVAGLGSHTITYVATSPLGCETITLTDTIEVISCQPPYISQVYNGGGKSKAIEVKNASNTQNITAGQYYLVWYEGNGIPANLSIPTAFIDLATGGDIIANGVKVFRSPALSNPAYIVPTATPFPTFQGYDGIYDVVIISTSNGANAYNDRIDVLGDNTAQNVLFKDYTQENYRSLVRMSCTPMGFPRVDYDEQDWVGFNRFGISTTGTYDESFEVAQGTLTNGELGRHFSATVQWIGSWDDTGIADPANESLPDRSRSVVINALYDTFSFGNFEACSLVSNQTLTINPLNNVKVQTKVTSTPPFNGIVVQNQGSLIQVRDSYYTESNQQLIVVNGQNSMKHSRETIGLNRGTDYVYWSSPLSLNPANKTAGQIFTFGSATGLFNPARFYRFENQNFYDMVNTYGDNGSGTDGYDDNLNDYMPFSSIPAAINEHLIPGRGYATWPPISSSGLFTNYAANYTVTFEGEMNNGKVEVPVYRNDSQFGTDSNLIGNPYPSPIDLNKFLFDPVNSTLIRPVAFIWGRFVDDTPLTSNPGPELLDYIEDNFKIYNPTMDIDPTQAPYSGNEFITNGTLASCQSFFVMAKDPDNGVNPIYNSGLIETLGNIRFSNYMRTTEPNNTFSRTSQFNQATNRNNTPSSDKLWVNVTDGSGYTVQLGVAFKEEGSATYNQDEDIETVQGRKYNFYTQSTSKDLIIDVQDEFNTSKEIPLGILNNNSVPNQTLTISIPRKAGVFTTQPVYLYDNETGITHNITTSSFSFTSNQVITEGRFKLVFEPNTSTIVNKQSSNVICSFNQNGLTLSSITSEIESYEVYDLEAPKSTGYLIASEKNAASKSVLLSLESKHRLISVKIKLKDGTQVVKKLAR